MKRLLALAIVISLTACAPRQAVINEGVSGTLTALAPTAFLPVDRPTSTPVPTLSPPTATDTACCVSTASHTLEPSPSASPDSAATTSPSDTPAPTETPALADAPLGELIFEDKFDSPGLWSLGETDSSNVVISGGALSFTQKTAGSFSFRITGKQGENFRARVTATLADRCASGDRYGLMFRVQDPSNYYAFQIDCDGRYRFVRYVADAVTPIVDWTFSEAVERGVQSVNTLEVTAQGGTFLLAVNGSPLATAGDATFAAGRFGLMVGSNTTKDFTVLFDDLTANKLP